MWFQAAEVSDDRFFLTLGFVAAAFFPLSSSVDWEKSFHFRQPSKSMSACMQPHSMTFCSSHGKFTGYEEVSKHSI